MRGRGDCCVARHGGGGVYDSSLVDKIMLRFRPIAPKPVSLSTASENAVNQVSPPLPRHKRKYVRSKIKNCKCARKAKTSFSDVSCSKTSGDGVVTLSLLPETPDVKENTAPGGELTRDLTESPSWKVPRNGTCHVQGDVGHVTGWSGERIVRQVASRVTVEGVTDTWTAGNEIGRTDAERLIRMERDTCPVFISDGGGRVLWANKAYGDMVGGQVAAVHLLVNESFSLRDGFTCKVRVTWGPGNENSNSSSLTAPCDVWKMDGGGFAWRLDVTAALCLGR